MTNGHAFKARVRILVKAFPQHSNKYEETVCCAGIRPSTGEFLRLFPIRFRRLPGQQKFERFDLVEMDLIKANDGRPESHKVIEGSINIVERVRDKPLSDASKLSLWQPFVYPSLADLEAANKEHKTSLGIIRPEQITFHHEPIGQANEEDQNLLTQQASLFEEPLKPLEPPEYSFFYRFKSGDKEYNRTIQDWEVQAAYRNFKHRYGADQVLNKLDEQYARRIPEQNLHFIMGTMLRYRWQFILIGVLRSPINPDDASRQGTLFGSGF